MTMAMARPDAFDAEESVIEAIRGGDRYALGEFIRRHDGWVRGVIHGVLGDAEAVDEVAQKVWTTAWQRIGELRDVRRWRPWLYRLACNGALDAGRRSTRRRSRARGLGDEPIPLSARTPVGDLSERERHEAVLAAIKALPGIYREPFVLRHFNGWSYRRIAEVMGMPADSVETRLVRARRLLRASLRDKVL